MTVADWNPADLKEREVYEYFDRPVLFSCSAANGRLFLAVLIGESRIDEEWLYAELSPGRLQSIERAEVDLHDAFARTESGKLWRIRLAPDGNPASMNLIDCESLRADQLPDPGAFLTGIAEGETIPSTNGSPSSHELPVKSKKPTS